jgi:flavin-dependent dehydrogenase
MWDAIVVGAGPAGAVAAAVLARNGRRVLLTDIVDPRSPKIGEALPGAAARLLRAIQLPIPVEHGPHTPIGGNLFCWNSDCFVASDFMCNPDGPGWRLDRARFDADLRAAAVQAGVFYRSEWVVGLKRAHSSWGVCFKSGARESTRWVIDATGRRAAIARRLGAKRSRDNQLVALYASGPSSSKFQSNRTVIEAVPSGWWYAARLPSGSVLAGFHTLQRHALHLLGSPARWHEALHETLHLEAMLDDVAFEHPPQASEAGGARLDRYSGDGWIACGDAALSFDPISGQGIVSALYGGLAAGRAVDDALNGRDTRLQHYVNQLDDIRRLYVARCLAMYRSERRFMCEPFWTSSKAEAAPFMPAELRSVSRSHTQTRAPAACP